jgi:hypothetical protein
MVKNCKFEIGMAVVLLAVYAVFYVWQTPGLVQGPLTSAEVERYLGALDEHMDAPPEAKRQFIADLRAWGATDDGAPVYMVNLLRYHGALLRWAGSPGFKDAPTPQQANDLYERSLAPLAFAMGVYPIFNGAAQGRNLIDHDAAADNWDRAAVMRFPSRRDFMKWASDPGFGRLFAYKYAAVEVALVPATAELLIPDLRVLVGAVLLIAYLLACLLRTLRNATPQPGARNLCNPIRAQTTANCQLLGGSHEMRKPWRAGG